MMTDELSFSGLELSRDNFAIGRNFSTIRHLLKDNDWVYNISVSWPTKDFFQLAPDDLYVVRQRWTEAEGQDGERIPVLELVLAARLQSSTDTE